jgi:hypothetical protein
MKEIADKNIHSIMNSTTDAQHSGGQHVDRHNPTVSVDNEHVFRARNVLRARASIERVLPPGLFRDSAWDLMLTLFIKGEEGESLFVKQLIVSTTASPTASMRRIAQLEEADLLERLPDALDQRRVTVRLTDRGRMAMTMMIEQIFDLERSP